MIIDHNSRNNKGAEGCPVPPAEPDSGVQDKEICFCGQLIAKHDQSHNPRPFKEVLGEQKKRVCSLCGVRFGEDVKVCPTDGHPIISVLTDAPADHVEHVLANTIPTQKEFLGDLRSFLIELQAHCSFIQWNFGEQQADPINKFWRARIPEWCDVLSPVDAGAQKARRLEIAFTIARKLAGNELHKEAVIRTAVEEAFEEDRAQREQMALTGETDAEFNETTLQIRDGTLKLDTSWLE